MESSSVLIALVLGITTTYFVEDYLVNKNARPKSMSNMVIVFGVVFGLCYVGMSYCDKGGGGAVMEHIDIKEPDW